MQRAGSVFLPVGALILMASHAQAADGMEQPLCPVEQGYSVMPIVHSARIAKGIYRAVLLGIGGGARLLKQYPIVMVTDAGDYWEVWQTNNDPPPKPSRDSVTVTAGGGQFSMEINKCTGAISHFVGNR
jgi:hypothetical protein